MPAQPETAETSFPSTQHSPVEIVQSVQVGLPKSLVFIMAGACAASVANIYYNQPLLSLFAKYFKAPVADAGLVATAAQVGYAAGLLFFVPLGDILERRKVILTLTYFCAGLLVLTAFSTSLPMLALMQLLVGLTAVSAQLLIPFAVDLAGPSQRGSTVGFLMAGLLGGLLGARAVSGVLADWIGWRGMFGVASALMLLTGVVLQLALPMRAPSQRLSYGSLLRSLWHLTLDQPVLRNASAVSALSFAAFCSFWAVLSFFLQDRYHLGSTPAGLFGLVGLAGAACAPLAGKLSDRRGPVLTLTVALILSALAFVFMWTNSSIAGLIIAVLVLDLGVQATQVAAQSEVIALLPDSRNRLNTVYMVSRFIGGAFGSWAGTFAYARRGWATSCAFSVAILAVGLAIHLRNTSRQ